MKISNGEFKLEARVEQDELCEAFTIVDREKISAIYPIRKHYDGRKINR